MTDLAGREPSTEAKERFSFRAKVLFAGYLMSAVGSGTVYPYLAVYVQQARGLGEGIAATTLAVMAFASILGSLIAGATTDRAGVVSVGVVSLLTQAIGYSLFGIAGQPTPILVSGVLAGLGSGAFLAVLAPLIQQVCSPSQHRRAFATRYMMNNLGIGLGALIAALTLQTMTAQRFAILYVANGISYVVLAACVWVALRPTQSVSRHATPPAVRTVSRASHVMLRDRTFGILMLIQALLVGAGFSQVQSVVPLYLRLDLGATATLISTLFMINCIGVVLLQPLVVRLAAHKPDTWLLSAVGLIWALAFLVGLVTLSTRSVGVGAIFAFFVLFTLGECFYGPSFQTILLRLAPPDQVGKYSSVSSSVWGAVSLIGPPLGVLAVGSGARSAFWVVCAVICGAAFTLSVAVLASRIQHSANPMDPAQTEEV